MMLAERRRYPGLTRSRCAALSAQLIGRVRDTDHDVPDLPPGFDRYGRPVRALSRSAGSPPGER